ncbi:MAG: queuosine precursor transporter [Planctomycetes bacterium]|nr:queuosine precursor transporter [Planctomycetota bacterium]
MHLTLADRRRRYERGYVAITATFAVLMVLTNVIGTKLFAFFPHWLPGGFGALSGNGPVILTTGLITYPLTFLFTDIASEIYGSRRANLMVTMGFFSSLLMLIIVNIAISVTPADRYWSDASGQLIHQCEIIAAVDNTVELSHRESLAQDSGQSKVLIAVLRDEAQPQRRLIFAQCHDIKDTSVEGKPGTYAKTTAQISGAEPKVGDIIVPAVRVVEFSATDAQQAVSPRMRIADGAMLPAQGILQDGFGLQFSYTHEAGSNWFRVAQLKNPGAAFPSAIDAWPTTFNSDVRPLAIMNTYSQVDMQSAMVATYASPAILLGASMLAYLIAQYLDVFLFHFWKRLTKGKMLWLRNNGSTWGSQFVDTIVVNGIFLPVAFGMTWSQTWSVIVCVYIVKIILAALDTPLIYLGVYICKKRLGYEMHEDVPNLMSDKAEALV